MTRTSAVLVVFSPRRSYSRSWRRRRSLGWISWGSSPISSRKRVPPLAAWTLPHWSLMAPVKDPRTWPKSSLSRSSLEREGQLTVTKGLSARWLRSWMALAMTLFPVPLSPRMRRLAGVAAARKRTSRVQLISGSSVSKRSGGELLEALSLRVATSDWRWLSSFSTFICFWTRARMPRRCSGVNGFSR